MKKVLIIEDEKRMREFIRIYLENEGYQVLESENGKKGLEIFEFEKPDLLILDIMMPLVDGYEVCRRIRKEHSIPIIILTALEGDDEHVKGYELGADDYITKPFKVKILMAKVRRLLEKSVQEGVADLYNEFGLMIDFEGRVVKVQNEEISLAPKEFDLLAFLVQNRKMALSREQILTKVWGYDFEGESRVVDNHVKKLRRKLGSAGGFIKTVVSVGYKFEGSSQ